MKIYSIYHHLKFHGCLYTINRLFSECGNFFFRLDPFSIHFFFSSLRSVQIHKRQAVCCMASNFYTIPFAIRQTRLKGKNIHTQCLTLRQTHVYTFSLLFYFFLFHWPCNEQCCVIYRYLRKLIRK